jgi:hypothetical protein
MPMNAAKFFREVVESNYLEFNRNPDDVKMLWNAVVSMNTVPEFVALDRLGYAEKSAGELNCAAKAIREREPCLLALKECEETFKHVRKSKIGPAELLQQSQAPQGCQPRIPPLGKLDRMIRGLCCSKRLQRWLLFQS